MITVRFKPAQTADPGEIYTSLKQLITVRFTPVSNS
jgi:hypothetical protein